LSPRKTGGEQVRRQPAAADAADVGHEVDHHERQPHGLEVEPVVALEEVGHPEEIQPPDRVGEELADREGPGLPQGKHRRPGQRHDRLGRITVDVRQLRGGHARMLLGPPIAEHPPDHPDEAQQAGDQERPLPAVVDGDPGHDERGDQGTDVRAGVEDPGGERALLLR